MNTAVAECEARTCTYHRQYLTRGPADLSHEGYHAAEDEAAAAHKRWDEHFNHCPTCAVGMNCATMDLLDRQAAMRERRIRA